MRLSLIIRTVWIACQATVEGFREDLGNFFQKSLVKRLKPYKVNGRKISEGVEESLAQEG